VNWDNVTEAQRHEAEAEAEDREIEDADAPDDYDAIVDEELEETQG
jgi:hypothetical protein